MDKTKFLKRRQELSKVPIDELVGLLESTDLQTRFIAEMCLRDATST
jgi:hypothetical protein